MKDTNQKTKEAKKFRLHSILKLHTRIMNQKLMNHAVGLTSILEKVKTEDREVIFNELVDLTLDLGLIGKNNADVSEMANKLQLTSTQEELQALFKLVTKPDKDILKEQVEELKEEELEKCSCNCAESKAKNSKTNTSKVTTKVIEIVATSKEDALEQIKQILKEGKIK
jgi:hypothetical protein